MKQSILAAVVFLLLASSALACLNDRQTSIVESEFRSRYESPANPGTAAAQQPSVTNSSELPVHSEVNPLGIVLAVTGILLIILDVKLLAGVPKTAGSAWSGRLIGRERAIVMGLGGLAITCLLFGGLVPTDGGLRIKIVTHPASYQLPKIPGGTSFRMAMLHDVLMERYLRHGQAWYEQRNKDSQAVIDEERAKPGPTTRMLDAMDDLAVGLENLHKSDEAAGVMRAKLELLPVEEVTVAAPTDPDLGRSSPMEIEAAQLQKIVAAAKLPPELHERYTAYANLGTSLIHGSFAKRLAGQGDAARDQMAEGLADIQKAIVINPGAHFGRETWQAVVVQHFLASLTHPELLTRYDIIGDDLSKMTVIGHIESRPDWLSAPASYLDATETINDRISERFQIYSINSADEWFKLVKPDIEQQVHFDEPALALMGMWMLGGGPNPHSALAMADIAMQVGQQEIAWDGFERALEMKENFSPDATVRDALADYCQKQQTAIANFESPDSPDEWTKSTRQRHDSELAWALKYQDDYHAWEAKQIAAGVALDDPQFYAGFFKDRPSIASPVGHADEVETRFFAPDGLFDGIPAGLLVGGILMLAGTHTARSKHAGKGVAT